MAGLRLGLGLGLQRSGGGASLQAGPTGVVTSTDELDEATTGAFATLLMVGGVEPGVFAKTGGSAALTISGNQVVASGAQTEGALSLELTVTDALGRVLPVTLGYTVAAEIAPPYVPPNSDDPVIPDPEDPEFDGGGFETSPITDDTSNGIKVSGKNGGSATFLLDWGTPAAGSIYTMRYTADWSRMSRLGREAAVGFAFRDGNDFHLVSLRGNGAASTVMLASKIYGDFRKSNQFTLTNDGAAANGTKDGPNWLQIEIAGDGSTYTLRSSADGATWDDEYTDTLPAPQAAATDALQFGPGGYFTNQDKGVFQIVVESYEEVALLEISGTPVLSATEGEAYAGFTASALGGTAPYVYSLVGTWPAGISIDADTGAVSGTPTEAGSFAGLSVRVTDAALATDDLDAFTLEVEAAPPTWFESSTAPVTSINPNDPHTFAGFDIGTAAADRVVVAVIGWGHSIGSSISGVTIGGVAASIAGASSNPASSHRIAIYYAVVPTGSTADVVVDFSLDIGSGGVCKVYYGYPASSTPLDTGGTTAASGGVITLSDLEIGVDGILIAGRVGSSGNPASFGWSGSDSIVTDEEGTANIVNYSFAHVMTSEASATGDLTCDPSGSSTNGMVAATWV